MDRVFSESRFLLQFITVSFVITLLLLLAFFVQIKTPDNLVGLLYVVTIPTYYYFAVVLVTFAFLPFYFFPYLTYLAIIPKFLLDIFLLTDIFVFNIYRFHIDLLLIDMVIHDFKGIGISPVILTVAAFSFLLILAINLYLFHKVKNSQIINAGKANLVLLVLLAIFLGGQFVHIWAREFNQDFITRHTPYFPHYHPITSHSLMSELRHQYPNLMAAPLESSNNALNIFGIDGNTVTDFNYPKSPMICDAPKEKPNILYFIIESWRADMMNRDITPNIAHMSESGYWFSNHFSGGNVTVSGLFSLMYGLHPTNMKKAQAEPYKYQSIFVRTLKEQDYVVNAYSTTNLDRFAMKTMIFGDIAPEAYVNQMANDVTDNDRYVVSKVVDSITNGEEKSWFKFVFLTSSHFYYYYPPEHKKFVPIPKNTDAFLFNRNIDAQPFLNNYKNSLHYVDSLFGEIWTALKKSGLDKNTIIVVTSDHGEEFNDSGKGHWGHGSNFTRYQTSVPLIIHTPDNDKRIKVGYRSGHVDIVPTLLTHVLGCQNVMSDYSSGEDLFDLPEEREFIQLGYTDKAYLIGDNVYATGLMIESYDVNNINSKNDEYEYDKINRLRKTESNFLK